MADAFLADALQFRQVQKIDFGSALTVVPARAGGEAKRPGEDLFELGIAVDAPPDVADDAAQTGREPAQASVGVDGHGHSSMLDQRQLADPQGLAKLDTGLRGKLDQAFSRAVNSLASVGNITTLAAHRSHQMLRLHWSTSPRQALLDERRMLRVAATVSATSAALDDGGLSIHRSHSV